MTFSTSRWLHARDRVDVEELMVLFGYASTIGVLHAINRGRFPIPTIKERGRRYALRSVVRAYFEKQVEAAEEHAAKQQAKIDRKLIARERREADQARKTLARETLARKLALKEQKRKEAEQRKYLEDKRKAQEIVDRGTLVDIRIGQVCNGSSHAIRPKRS